MHEKLSRKLASSILFLVLLLACSCNNEVTIHSESYEDREHFVVSTSKATYWYDKDGGGLSRLIDPNGADWIGFKIEPWGDYPQAAASAFRGIPNIVYGAEEGGAGHPGHDQCTSTAAANSITTQSLSGQWKWKWQFKQDYARLDISDVGPSPYWFLYEGTPGGKFEPGENYFGNNLHPTPVFDQPDFYEGSEIFENWDWAYFGHRDSPYVLLIIDLTKNDKEDTFSYLGNSELGTRSEDGMVVYGFGRAENATPLLKQPSSYIITLLRIDNLTALPELVRTKAEYHYSIKNQES